MMEDESLVCLYFYPSIYNFLIKLRNLKSLDIEVARECFDDEFEPPTPRTPKRAGVRPFESCPGAPRKLPSQPNERLGPWRGFQRLYINFRDEVWNKI